jgi:hypothetical protein
MDHPELPVRSTDTKAPVIEPSVRAAAVGQNSAAN